MGHAAIIVEDSPDLTSGVASAWAADSVGHLKTHKLIPLLTVEEAMEGLRKAGEMASGFPRPGGPSGGGSS